MNNKIIAIGIIVLVVGLGIFFLKNTNASSNVIKEDGNSNNVQEVTIGFKGNNYSPQKIEVEVNQPVRIYLDSSVYGCYRAFTIRSLGVSKYLATTNDYVEFTPTKKGNYPFSCSMGMGTGRLVVK